jgi:hypothetical protein
LGSEIGERMQLKEFNPRESSGNSIKNTQLGVISREVR